MTDTTRMPSIGKTPASIITNGDASRVVIKEDNRLRPEDEAAHEWYRFVLSFPPHLVREYIARFRACPGQCLLDPFAGTGTTLVEAKRLKIASVGIEANPIACFASQVKVNWGVDPDGLLDHAHKIAKIVAERLRTDGIEDTAPLPLFHGKPKANPRLRTLPADTWDLLLKDSISPLPLHKALVLIDALRENADGRFNAHEKLAIAKVVVFGASNLRFGPEVGLGTIKADAPVVQPWLESINRMAADLRHLHTSHDVPAVVHCADARYLGSVLEPDSVDFVITSPPYPNEKDYTRTTRLESVLLGFIRSKQDLRTLKQDLVRSNTRSVYKSDRDDLLIADHDEIQQIADEIEERRIALGKTSGFERLYGRVTKLYFGGMARHLADLRTILRPGAQLAYVVGDQASYLRVMIRTGQLLADIATSLDYEVEGIDLFRTRLATATKEQLREEVLLLRWPGRKTKRRRTIMASQKIYASIIEAIFTSKFKPGARHVDFERSDIVKFGNKLKIALPKNLGDLVYSFRYRKAFPAAIQAKAAKGEAWIIRGAGRGKYRFVLVADTPLTPNSSMVATKVPDATPGIVTKYAFGDEQALLTKLRYNRLIDIFLGITCYSLQNHLRTTVDEMGQIETDEVYVGVDKKGAHYVIPIQAKGGKDNLNIVQIEQDLAACQQKFPSLICRPVAAQFMREEVIALFAFEEGSEGVGIVSEKHYRLVPPEDVTEADLTTYRDRTTE